MSDWRISYARQCVWCKRVEPELSPLFIATLKSANSREALLKLAGDENGMFTFTVDLGQIHTDECARCQSCRQVADALMQEP